MDRGECRMSGSGGGLISLDDLESVSEEQLSDSAEDEHEEDMMEGQDRLLNYWRDVARGHQVDVPTGNNTTTIITTHTVTRMRVHTRGNNRDPL